MKHINSLVKTAIKQLNNQSSETSNSLQVHKYISKDIAKFRAGEIEEINEAMVTGDKMSPTDFASALAIIQTDLEIKLSDEKKKLIWHSLVKRGWTTEMLHNSVEHILENNKYPNITLADFIQSNKAMPKLYSRSWYLKKLNEFPYINKELQCYVAYGCQFYKWYDGKNIDNKDFKLIWSQDEYVK